MQSAAWPNPQKSRCHQPTRHALARVLTLEPQATGAPNKKPDGYERVGLGVGRVRVGRWSIVVVASARDHVKVCIVYRVHQPVRLINASRPVTGQIAQ